VVVATSDTTPEVAWNQKIDPHCSRRASKRDPAECDSKATPI
jgi:hypothetical protein